jgi:hypothetical protein
MRTFALASALFLASFASAQPVPVKIVRSGEAWTLERGGKPYFIKGGGGQTQLEVLKKSGGNSIRTWGAETLGKHLDEAHALGLTVTAGLWLGHERHGFNYNNADQVAKQFEECRQAVLKYKDHPALLAWGIGNEMEAEGDNAAIWSAINSLAAMVKELDPNHPTMTVIAGAGPAKIKNIHRLCPAIDIIGINSYAPAVHLPREYRERGGTKPYILTEFGPRGQWESPLTAWKVPLEPTSTQKAEQYRESYQAAVVESKGMCLGSYAFIWGHKQEATDTWFGLFLADGARTGGVDVLTEFWSGKPPADRCPTIEPIVIEGGTEFEAGKPFTASVKAADPEGRKLTYTWTLMGEPAVHANGGDAIPPLKVYAGAVKALEGKDAGRAEVRLPDSADSYRLYVVVKDASGAAATANVPVKRKK